MIQMETMLNVADNSGARREKCVKVLGGSSVVTALPTSLLALFRSNPGGSVKRGDIVRFVIVRNAKDTRRKTVAISALIRTHAFWLIKR